MGLPPSAASVAHEVDMIGPAGSVAGERRRRFRVATVRAERAHGDVRRS